jgi:hypothetical protein
MDIFNGNRTKATITRQNLERAKWQINWISKENQVQINHAKRDYQMQFLYKATAVVLNRHRKHTCFRKSLPKDWLKQVIAQPVQTQVS